MTLVEAPARLHFGLLSVPVAGQEPGPFRQFGGVGLMLDSPRWVVCATRSNEWNSTGSSAQRAVDFAQRFTATLGPSEQSPFQITVSANVDEHAGLGSGTALALAVAKAIACETSHADWPSQELAKRVGRGLRSAIGVHGFATGGLVVEAGKLPGECIAPLVGRYEFPTEWRIALLRPRIESPWHGPREIQAFHRCGHSNPTDALCRLIVQAIVPALISQNLQLFGDAIHEYNRRAGEAFAAAQGGTYVHPAVGQLIAELRSFGIVGAGQSSWGPTVFAILADEERGRWLTNQFTSCDVSIVRASNRGATAKTSLANEEFS